MGPIRGRLVLALGMLLLTMDAGAAKRTVLVGPDGTLTFRDPESATVTTTVTVGDDVEWQWVSGSHSTARLDAPETWSSGVHAAPFSFSRRFMVAGTFPYVCTVHEALGMGGTVVVLASISTTLPATTMTVTSTTRTTTTTLPPALQCEDTVARQLAMLGRVLVGCHIRAAKRTFRHRPVREAACARRGRACYVAAVRRLSPGRCPGCLLGKLANGRDGMTSLVDGLLSDVYCVPVEDGSVRASRSILRCENGAARSSAKLVRSLLHCRIGAANATFTGQPFDEAGCRAAAKDRFDGVIGKLRLGLCPPCLDPGRLRDELEAAVERLSAAVYCSGSTSFQSAK